MAGEVVDLLDRDAEVQQPCNKRIIDKVASRKLGVTAAAGAAAATGAVEVTWPMAAIAVARP